MTSTTETAGTSLAPVAPGVLARVQDGKTFTIADLLSELVPAAPAAPVAQEAPAPATAPKPALAGPPKHVTLTARLREALKSIPLVFGTIEVKERRRLTADELARLTQEGNEIDAAVDMLGKRRAEIADLVRTHQDFQAEDEGRTEVVMTSGVGKGHYLAATEGHPFETPVEGFEDSWSQRFTAGKATPSIAILVQLVADGTVTSREAAAITRKIPVIDEVKLSDAIRKDPARFLQILAAITRRAEPGAQLHAPKK